MCNLVAKWLHSTDTEHAQTQTQASELVEDYLRSIVRQEFNPKLADTVFVASQVCRPQF